MSAWLTLVLAGFFEVGFTTCMKLSEGFSRWPWTAGFAASALTSFVLLGRATSSGAIPMGTAYAVWTGIGAAGTVLVGIVAFGEPAGAARIALLLVLVGAVLGLKMVG